MVDRIREFQRLLAERISDRNVPTAHGIVHLVDEFPDVYDANYLSVEGAAAPAETLAAEADATMEGRSHRRISVEGGGAGLTEELAELGFVLSTHLILTHRQAPDRLVDTSPIREVPLDAVLPARTAATLDEPWGDQGIADQLNGVKRRVGAAVPTRWFAAIVDGEIAGYCELREADGVAQIEDVEVLEHHRGLGLGRAVVQHALQEALRRNEIVWLEALADDWPRELYAKLGFQVVDRRDVYTRLPHPLTRLRLRTPRLELRLGTIAELRELYRVAAGGIHDPAEMPFAVPWTDSLEEEAYLAHHRLKLDAWRPDAWDYQAVAFLDGRPIGSQALEAERFAERRTVATGSWLGRSFQGQGLGTEMRSAILALAFDGLGAELAESGAIAGNAASLGVSRKLGYEVVGSHTIAPRGAPVEHDDLELRRERFTPPVRTAIEGLDAVRSLFGV